MNKGTRTAIARKKWAKRLKVLGLKPTAEQRYTCYKAQAKPCSCSLCRRERYSRKIKHPKQEIA